MSSRMSSVENRVPRYVAPGRRNGYPPVALTPAFVPAAPAPPAVHVSPPAAPERTLVEKYAGLTHEQAMARYYG